MSDSILPYLPTWEELEKQQQMEKELEEENEFNNLLRDASMEFPEVDYLLESTSSNIKFLPTGNLHLSTGKAKSGKTTANSILISSILGHGESFGFKALKDDSTVLYIDTEQDDADHVRVLRYINVLCGHDAKFINPRIHSLHCVDTDANDILDIVEKAIIKYNPTLCYIDGIRDCLVDFNNIEQVSKVMDKLKHIKQTYKCAILCVLHTNKDESDNNPRGHLGTELVNKMCDGFLLKRDKDVFVMEHFASRHRQIDNVRFIRDSKYGMPEVYNELTPKEQKEYVDTHQVAKAIAKTFKDNGNQPLNTGELQTNVAELTKICKRSLETKWKTYIEYMQVNLNIEKDGRSTLYSLKDPDNYIDNIHM